LWIAKPTKSWWRWSPSLRLLQVRSLNQERRIWTYEAGFDRNQLIYAGG
jgi:hypothetical protein